LPSCKRRTKLLLPSCKHRTYCKNFSTSAITGLAVSPKDNYFVTCFICT
jgi:hypothetical protein